MPADDVAATVGLVDTESCSEGPRVAAYEILPEEERKQVEVGAGYTPDPDRACNKPDEGQPRQRHTWVLNMLALQAEDEKPHGVEVLNEKGSDMLATGMREATGLDLEGPAHEQGRVGEASAPWELDMSTEVPEVARTPAAYTLCCIAAPRA